MIISSGLLLLGVLGPAAGAEQLVHPPALRHPHLYQGEHQVRGYTAALSIGEDYFKDINFFQLFNSQQPSWSLKYCSILETNLFSLSTFCKHPAYKRHWCIMFLWQDYFPNIPNAMQILESLSTQSLADLFFCLTVSRLWSDKQRFTVWSYDNSGTESEFNIFLFFTHCTDWDQWRPGPEMRQSRGQRRPGIQGY